MKTRAFIDNDDSESEIEESIVQGESKEDFNETVNSDTFDDLLDDDDVDANHNKSIEQKQKKITAKEAKRLFKKPMSPLPEQPKSDYELLQDQNIAEKEALVSILNDWD